jgi:uncharacterized protein YkwD
MWDVFPPPLRHAMDRICRLTQVALTPMLTMMRPLSGRLRMSMRTTCSVSRSGHARLAIAAVVLVSCATPMATSAPQRTAPSSVPTTATRDYSRIEAEVRAALNQARTSPALAATWLEELAGYYSGTRVKRPWWPITLQTTEGLAAVREAIAALRAQAAVPALSLNSALVSAARDHANDQARTGATGHIGGDGSTTIIRVNRYATWQVSIAENIDYQPMVRGRDVIESLLVDDGVPDRGHRKNIFQPTARLVGIACGPHPKYEAMCVIVQTGGLGPK